jgi:hypothetical protein
MVWGKAPSAAIHSARVGSWASAIASTAERTALTAALGEGGDEEARRGAGLGQVGEVGGHVGVSGQETARGRVEAIALLGHRQGDDVDVGRGHGRDDGGGVLGRDQHALNRADDAGAVGDPIADDDAVETVLGIQLIADARRAQRHPEDAPAQVAGPQGVVEHHRLMRPVKGADAQMDHPGPDRRAIIAGAFDVSGQACEGRFGQSGHSL